MLVYESLLDVVGKELIFCIVIEFYLNFNLSKSCLNEGVFIRGSKGFILF